MLSYCLSVSEVISEGAKLPSWVGGEQACCLVCVCGLEELDALESSAVKTLSSVVCWQALLKVGSPPPYDLFTAADSNDPLSIILAISLCCLEGDGPKDSSPRASSNST
eukprot:scaffold98469_cov63-Cyclotella_meneghiniana.AAC.12